jgi:hypothetical protein
LPRRELAFVDLGQAQAKAIHDGIGRDYAAETEISEGMAVTPGSGGRRCRAVAIGGELLGGRNGGDDVALFVQQLQHDHGANLKKFPKT